MDPDVQFIVAAIAQYGSRRPQRYVQHWVILGQVTVQDNGDNQVMVLTLGSRSIDELDAVRRGCRADEVVGTAALRSSFAVL
ncbi:hypothetical protein DOTSEDRAFT_70717 [Dothistroma septosporum NZE10]|uniref:Uncharacterized protein n=1 Tax=Dothistroma septosporum (strain NZE10 / CBS 128990) TaxID=675120 RepID=N1PTR8_DOTSN|nr:hypothetical protein DOTSEDRAFT_70717 [Dothistroma septosporum NZE10]